MSDDQPENVAPVISPVLRREALLPGERSRGLGTVAVVCTMAGVASGLALATTLMAMQVADSMSSRGCPRYEAREVRVVQVPSRDHGFLGVFYDIRNGYADVRSVVHGTPAEAVGLRAGDHILAIDDAQIAPTDELKARVFAAAPGSTPTLTVERDGEILTVRPTLIAYPTITTD
jgi:S1-C subfamily serine protease